MVNMLSLKKVDLPLDWKDDVRMNFLFATFRPRTANPEGWDAKLKFWINFVHNLCLKCEVSVINLGELRSAIERKGNYPQCLDIVLENMHSQGLIVNLSDFSKIEAEKGWIGWGFDMIVQKPVSWGFSALQGFLSLKNNDEKFVVIAVVKELATKVLNRHNELVNSELIDNIVFLDTFEEECKNICCGVNFNLAIIQLQKDKHVYVFEDKGRKVIKFRGQDDKKVKPLTELDRGILNLQTAKDKVLNDIDTLEKDIKSSVEEIKELLRSGYKTKAMFSLKKKKRLEVVLKKKSVVLDNIENLLFQLQNCDSEKMVLEAYKSGTQAIKAQTKDDLNLDNIDTTMAEVEGAIDDYEEIKRSISKSVTPFDESLEDFEDELNDLLNNEKQKEVPNKKEESPTKITDEEILKRLSALRTPPEGVPPVKKLALNKRLASNYRD